MKKIFKYVNDWASIRLVDSFVKICKAGTGSGEACLYMGSKYDPDIFNFFEEEDFDAHCTMLRDDIIEYLNAVKWEYISHRYNYRNEVNADTWQKLYNEVESLPEELFFNLTRKRQQDKHGRVYAMELAYKKSNKLEYQKSPNAYTYDLIRRIAIPEVSFLMLTKMCDNQSNFLAKIYYDPDEGGLTNG